MMVRFWLCIVAVLITWTGGDPNATCNRYGQPIIIDTDIMSDVDDVGALAVANVLHNCGLADIKGVVVNTHSNYGALATSVRPFT